jgi:preprotein translocase subunit SecE
VADRKRGSAGDGFDGDDDRTRRGRDDLNAEDSNAEDSDLDDGALGDDAADDDAVDDVPDDAIDDDEAAPKRRSRASSPVAVARTRAPRTRTGDDHVGLFTEIVRFIREVVAELQKVIWPTRKELLTYTSVVVVFVAVMMTLVALLDLGFAQVMFIVFGGTAE